MKFNTQDWKIIWYFFRPYKLRSLIVLGAMFVSGFFEMLNLAAIYPIINYGLNVNSQSRILQYFNQLIAYVKPENPFFASCLLLIIISILAVVSKYLHYFLSNKLTVRIVGDTQTQMMAKFIGAEYNFFVKNQQGELIYAGTMAPERMSLTILSVIRLFHSLISTIFFFALLVFLSWQLTLAILFAGLVYGIVVKKIMKQFIYKSSAVYVQENQNKNVVLNEFITGIKAIKVYMAFDEWRKRHEETVANGLFHRFRVMMGKVFPEMFTRFVFFMLIAIAGIILSSRPLSEIMTLVPLLGTFVVVTNRFLPSTNLVGNSVMSIAEYIPDARIVHDLCQKKVVTAPEGDKSGRPFSDKIVFRDVWFKYENMDEDLLKSISFSIAHKNITAIVGASGSGKTTIINLLLKLYRPDKGSITIDGVDIFELTNKSYLSKIGYVSQETFIFNSTFKENIRFGKEQCTDEMIEEAAKLANAHEFIMNTKDGYNTVVGDAGVKISGGQRQRIAIARAMLRRPEIIVLDEATSSLDNISERKIQLAINNISKHTTILVIAHRLSTVRNADKIVIIKKGAIVEQGTHEELLKNKDVYYDLHTSKDTVDREVVEEEVV